MTIFDSIQNLLLILSFVLSSKDRAFIPDHRKTNRYSVKEAVYENYLKNKVFFKNAIVYRDTKRGKYTITFNKSVDELLIHTINRFLIHKYLHRKVFEIIRNASDLSKLIFTLELIHFSDENVFANVQKNLIVILNKMSYYNIFEYLRNTGNIDEKIISKYFSEYYEKYLVFRENKETKCIEKHLLVEDIPSKDLSKVLRVFALSKIQISSLTISRIVLNYDNLVGISRLLYHSSTLEKITFIDSTIDSLCFEGFISNLDKVNFKSSSLNSLVIDSANHTFIHLISTIMSSNKGNLKMLKILNSPEIFEFSENVFEFIGELRELKSLNLCNNKLRKIPKELNNLRRLRSLNISNNKIKDISKEFCDSIEELRRLNLNNNYISNIPEEIYTLYKLRELSICNNLIERLPEGFYSLFKLRVLDLKKNFVSEISEKIRQLEELEELYLDENEITRIPKGLEELKKLRVISMKFNGITEFPKEIFEIENIREISMNNNSIQHIVSYNNKSSNRTSIIKSKENCSNESSYELDENYDPIIVNNLKRITSNIYNENNSDRTVMIQDIKRQISFDNNQIKYFPIEIFLNSKLKETISIMNNPISPINESEYQEFLLKRNDCHLKCKFQREEDISRVLEKTAKESFIWNFEKIKNNSFQLKQVRNLSTASYENSPFRKHFIQITEHIDSLVKKEMITKEEKKFINYYLFRVFDTLTKYSTNVNNIFNSLMNTDRINTSCKVNNLSDLQPPQDIPFLPSMSTIPIMPSSSGMSSMSIPSLHPIPNMPIPSLIPSLSNMESLLNRNMILVHYIKEDILLCERTYDLITLLDHVYKDVSFYLTPPTLEQLLNLNLNLFKEQCFNKIFKDSKSFVECYSWKYKLKNELNFEVEYEKVMNLSGNLKNFEELTKDTILRKFYENFTVENFISMIRTELNPFTLHLFRLYLNLNHLEAFDYSNHILIALERVGILIKTG